MQEVCLVILRLQASALRCAVSYGIVHYRGKQYSCNHRKKQIILTFCAYVFIHFDLI